MVRLIVGVAIAALLAGAAGAQEGEKKENEKQKRDWGITVGAYFPVDEEIRDLFGNGLLRLGISPINRKFDKSWDITTDINILWAEENGARLILIPLTVGGVVGWGEDSSRGFLAVNTGPAYYDYRLYRAVPADGTTVAEFRERKWGWNSNVELGFLMDRKLSVTGRYDWYSKSDGFDFSGFSVNINYVFFKW